MASAVELSPSPGTSFKELVFRPGDMIKVNHTYGICVLRKESDSTYVNDTIPALSTFVLLEKADCVEKIRGDFWKCYDVKDQFVFFILDAILVILYISEDSVTPVLTVTRCDQE